MMSFKCKYCGDDEFYIETICHSCACVKEGAPEGYALVPIEPTEAMLEATVSFINLGRLTKNVSHVIYMLMIAKAQENNDGTV